MSCPLSVCSCCGRARERLVEMVPYDDGRKDSRMGKYASSVGLDPGAIARRSGRNDIGRRYVARKPVTMGWSDCGCQATWLPGTVLDPFAGTSSTGHAALR